MIVVKIFKKIRDPIYKINQTNLGKKEQDFLILKD